MDIAFYCHFDFHRTVLEPVYLRLAERFECLFTTHMELILSSRPQVVVMAERLYDEVRENLPDTTIVWLRHGFASKNNFAPSVLGCDYACLNSEWTRDQCIDAGVAPRRDFWVTGFVPADVLVSSHFQVPPELVEQGFSRALPTLLYAPTYNPLLNSVTVLGTNWTRELEDGALDVNVIIKPHPVIGQRNPEWMDAWRQLCTESAHVYLVEDTHSSIFPYFRLADVLLSDASSVIFYFLAVDRPIILVNNPRRFEEPVFFDAHGPEWSWRDVGIELDSADDLLDAVHRCLVDPGFGKEARDHYAARVFGNLRDGGSAERVATKLSKLVSGGN